MDAKITTTTTMADKKLHTADSESTTDKVIEKSDSAEMPPFKKEEKFFVPLNFFGLLILKNERMKSIEEKNNVKLIILPAENSSTEKVGLQILQINGDPKDVEKAVLVIQNILEEDDGKNRLKRILPKQHSKDGSEFECPICCETFNISDDECVKCTPTDIFEQSTATSATTNESHSICISCIQEYARSAITGRVAVGGLGLNCVSDGCKNVFLLSSFEKYLNDEIRKPFLTRLQEQCVLETNLKDLVTCPECGYKVCVPETDTFYICECGRQQCRSCPRLYDEKHVGKTCKQLADQEARLESAQKPETKMSEIVVRKCHRCGTQFVKDDACNFMESCPCGAKQCYICGEPNITYSHFCNCQQVTHGECPECGKSCRQWENDRELDEMRIGEFLRQNGVTVNLPTFEEPPRPRGTIQIPPRQEFNELVRDGMLRGIEEFRNAPNFNENNPVFMNIQAAYDFIQQRQNERNG